MAFYFITVRPRPDRDNNLGSTIGLFMAVLKVLISEYSWAMDRWEDLKVIHCQVVCDSNNVIHPSIVNARIVNVQSLFSNRSMDFKIFIVF